MINIKRTLLTDFLFEIFSGLYVLAVVVNLWTEPVYTTLLLVFGLLIQMAYWREKSDSVIMLVAALLGAPAEMICVKMNVWTYNAPGLFAGIPVWIPLVWAFLLLLFRRFALSLNSAFKKLINSPDSLIILYYVSGSLIIIYYAATVYIINKIIALIFSIFMVPAIIFWHEHDDIMIFIIGAIFGTLGEYICMRSGFWYYHYPFIKSIGLPLSLPLAWGLSSVIINRAMLAITKNR